MIIIIDKKKKDDYQFWPKKGGSPMICSTTAPLLKIIWFIMVNIDYLYF